jgi:hypothetical protein
VNVHDDVEEFALILGDSKVGPGDHSVRPRDFSVVVPPLIQIHRVVRLRRSVRWDKSEPSPGVDERAIRQIYDHEDILTLRKLPGERLRNRIH